MKHLKIGFAAIIAVLAISVTVASHAGIFNKAKAAPALVANCFKTGTTTADPIKLCTSPTQLVFNSTACNIAQSQVGQGVSANVSGVINSEQCPPSTTVFCCAVLEIDPLQQCPAFAPPGLPLNHYRIAQVFCKQS